jgi:hypothetical protein
MGGILGKAQAFTRAREWPGLLHTALKASINCERARPLACGLAIASPAPNLGVGDRR